MDINQLKNVATEYGTPTFAFDCDEVRGRAASIKEIMNDGLHNNTIKLCYSIKANPFLIKPLLDTVDYLEVCSPGELQICIHSNVPGDKIIYSGVHKELCDITEAISYGAYIITAESVRHYELILEAVKNTGKSVRVLPRLSSKSQFGMSYEDIELILDKNKNNEMVDIIGLHYFVGTQRTKLKHQQKELTMLRETVESLREKYRIPLEWLEYGPGLAYPYFEGDDFSDTLRPMKELKAELDILTEFCKPTIEMGRFLASSCGYYLTGVSDTKRSYDNNWVIVDGGINHVNYLGSMMGLKVPVISVIKSDNNVNADMVSEHTICGSLCTTNDVLVRSYSCEELRIGDILVFHNIGAYSITEGLNLFLSRTMPKVVLVEKSATILARDAKETYLINSGLI